MCFSSDASLFSFIVNVIICTLLYNTNGPPVLKSIAVFFGYIGIVQLFDWILWENQNNEINKFITKIEMIHINLEPLVLAYIIYLLNDHLTSASWNILIIYSIFGFIYTLNTFNNRDYDYTPIEKVNGENRLIWKWNNTKYGGIVYTLFTLAFIILGYDNFEYPHNLLFVTLTVSTVLFGILYKNREAGRYWCKISSYIPLLFLLKF